MSIVIPEKKERCLYLCRVQKNHSSFMVTLPKSVAEILQLNHGDLAIFTWVISTNEIKITKFNAEKNDQPKIN
jgi:antitoxin component of MazEF toxin-antitoxin module